MEDEKSHQGISRRLWLHSVTLTTVGLSINARPLIAKANQQSVPLADVVRAMSAITGQPIAEKWVNPTASLLGIILHSTKGLRDLDLGDLEPKQVCLDR